MKGEEFDFIGLSLKYGYVGRTGAIRFSSPYFSIVCKELGIKYSSLTRMGKCILKADCIDAYNMEREVLRDSKEYLL